jgi:hypothetical protein
MDVATITMAGKINFVSRVRFVKLSVKFNRDTREPSSKSSNRGARNEDKKQ